MAVSKDLSSEHLQLEEEQDTVAKKEKELQEKVVRKEMHHHDDIIHMSSYFITMTIYSLTIIILFCLLLDFVKSITIIL